MAKQPAKAGKSKDQHASGFMVRLPEALRIPLEQLKEKTGQPYTVAVKRALDAYLKTHGIDQPTST